MAQRLVFTAAIFDLMHRGHLNLLREMRKYGDYSIAVLHDDASCFLIKDKIPIQNLEQRTQNLWITGLVDEVLVTHSVDPADQFGLIVGRYGKQYKLLFLRGDDNLHPPGLWFLNLCKIDQLYIPYTEGVSSTEIQEGLR